MGPRHPQRSLAFEPNDATYLRLLSDSRSSPPGSRISAAFGGVPHLSPGEMAELRRQQANFARASRDRNCPAVPPAPPGVSLAENMNLAARSVNPFWFYNQVRNHGPWDYKQRGRGYEDFGNFNYGATATAFGFPSQVTKRMAGYAQIRAKNSQPRFGKPWTQAPYGYDPHDQAMIEAGIKYRRIGC